MTNTHDPLKPWKADLAEGFGRVDWVVTGGCPMQLTMGCGVWDGECSSECRCNCAHCEGEGTHLIVMHLTKEEAQKVAAMNNIADVEQFLLSLGDRFVYSPPTLEEAYRRGVRQRVVENPDSKDIITVFPARRRNATP